MYLVIFETGFMMYTAELRDDLIPAAQDGVIDIVDISNPANPLRYGEEGWCSVDVG